jgi:glycosyltransferase involved in cell wall biosynthesis
MVGYVIDCYGLPSVLVEASCGKNVHVPSHRQASPIAVVVATRNRRAELVRTLCRLGRLPEQPHVIVVDNGSNDGTADIVRRLFPEVELVALEANVGPAARTIGARRAGCETVAFSDDDSWWHPGSLQRAANLFERHPRLGLVAARVLVGSDARLDATSRAMAQSPLSGDDDLPGVPVLGFIACGAVVRRSAFLAIGGFPTGGVGGEEKLVALDMASQGWALRYVEEVIAYHHPSPRRNYDARASAEMLNDLTTAWARRPVAVAVRLTAAAFLQVSHPATRQALRRLLRLAPTLARARRPVPPTVERDMRVLETGGAASRWRGVRRRWVSLT